MGEHTTTFPTLKDMDRLLSPEHRFADAMVQMERELADIPLRVDADRLYTTAEVAARLAISKRTLEGWRAAGKGPRTTTLPGGQVRYRGQHLKEFIDLHAAA